MRHALWIVLLGLGGLSLAVALSLGAFALAGGPLREPISGVVLSESTRHVGAVPGTLPTASPDRHHPAGSEADTATEVPPVTPAPGDDRGPQPGGQKGGDD